MLRNFIKHAYLKKNLEQSAKNSRKMGTWCFSVLKKCEKNIACGLNKLDYLIATGQSRHECFDVLSESTALRVGSVLRSRSTLLVDEEVVQQVRQSCRFFTQQEIWHRLELDLTGVVHMVRDQFGTETVRLDQLGKQPESINQASLRYYRYNCREY